MKKSEYGFSIVEVLLIVIIVGILGFAGWKIYDAGKNSPRPSTSTSQTDQQTSTNTSPSTNATPNSKDNFLVIKEWSVKAQKPTDQTLSYTIETESDGSSLALFTSADLAKAGGTCAKDVGPGGHIGRYKAGTIMEDGIAIENQAGVKKIGGYYFLFVNGNGFCNGSSTETQTSVRKDVKTLIDTLQAE